VLAGRELVLGVTGSIAAYKAAYLVRELRRLGAGVTVVMTEHAMAFVAPLTFRTLSGRPVLSDLFDPHEPAAVEHVALAERADLVLVAPATANALARAALGLADDFLGTLLLAARAPVLFAPAMDGEMWHHPAVQGHVAGLRARGATVMEPGRGELASGLQAARTISHDEAAQMYDGYLNDFYRSMKAWRRGNELAGRIECGRSLRFLGELLFALDGVRAPYPKDWQGKLGELEPLILEVARTGAPHLQQEICVIVRDRAAQHGYSHVYEAWTGDIDHALSFEFA